MIQAVDHLALLPGYAAAVTAVVVLLVDLLVGRRTAVLAVLLTGAVATAVAALPATGSTFCVDAACSWVGSPIATVTAVLFAALTAGVLALSAPALRAGAAPVGEYCFLLACAMTGGVVVGYAGDLITLIVGLETLTLPLYLLVGLRRPVPGFVVPGGSAATGSGPDGAAGSGAAAAVTFFVVSVVSTSVALLGAALVYASTGALHLSVLAFPAPVTPLASVGVTLLVVGLAFKVAAVPLHAWAPVTYDGAPLPIAAYLSTASKLGGVVALLAVLHDALPPERTGPVLAVLAVLTMTVANLVALRQTRLVRLLAWSSVAQAGYILAPLAAIGGWAAADGSGSAAVTAALAYTIFFVVLELAAFAAVIALRPTAGDGGTIADLRGAGRRSPWAGAVLVLALTGLAGLPPGLAGLFAKVAVVRSLLAGGAGWLAVVVALNAVIALAYYLRVAVALYAPSPDSAPLLPARRMPWPVAAALAAAAAVALVLGFAPQLVLDAVAL